MRECRKTKDESERWVSEGHMMCTDNNLNKRMGPEKKKICKKSRLVEDDIRLEHLPVNNGIQKH